MKRFTEALYFVFCLKGTERDYDRGADAYMNATKVEDVCSCESMSNVEQNEFTYYV